MKFKGINYNAGIDYNQCGEGKELDIKKFQEDLEWIKKANCNSIRLYGSHNEKLLEYTKIALKQGFTVFASPRYIGNTQEETLSKLISISHTLEQLRKKDNIVLIIGNEFTIDIKGLVKGEKLMDRVKHVNENKEELLEKIFQEFIPEIRRNFKGKISYASLVNENINFNHFDIIGINYYWYLGNMIGYSRRLTKLKKKYSKPIIITEFGTTPYLFASLLDGGAYYPIQEMNLHKKIPWKWFIIPNENEQVRNLKKCFNAFEKANVNGTFVFDFCEKWKYKTGKKSLHLAAFSLMESFHTGILKPRKAFKFLSDYYSD